MDWYKNRKRVGLWEVINGAGGVMHIYRDPQKEEAVIAPIIDDKFDQIPNKCLIPAEAFTDPRFRIIYGAAVKVRNQGVVTVVGSVNRQIIEDNQQGRLLAELKKHDQLNLVNSFEDWPSQINDHSISFSEPSIVWAFDDLGRYYRSRRALEIGKALEEGNINVAEATKQLQILEEDHAKRETPKDIGIFEFLDNPPKAQDNLLGNRFLERTGSLLFVAQSGIGKSSASVQQDIEWSCGRTSFGIKPNGALKILTIQAEDTDGDMHEFVHGVKESLNLTKEEVELCNRNCRYVAHKELTGLAFLTEIVEPLLKKVKPDILRINPFQAYLGADISDPSEIAKFCRNTLNKMLEDYNCGCIIVHHTPKTTYQDKEEWKLSDWMYSCIGSADLTNWARAVLVITAIKDEDKKFAWIAAKRGRKAGWVNDDGKDVCITYYQHSDDGVIVWSSVDQIDIPVKDKKGRFAAEYKEQDVLQSMDLIQPKRVGGIQKDTCENTGMSKAQFYVMWKKLREEGKVIETPEGWRKLL